MWTLGSVACSKHATIFATPRFFAPFRTASAKPSVVRPTEFNVTTPVRTTFTFTRDEYILALKRHYRSTLKIRRDVIAGLAAIAGGAYLLFTSDEGWIAWLLLIGGTVLLTIVGYATFLLPISIYDSQPKLKDQYSLSDQGYANAKNYRPVTGCKAIDYD